MKNRVILIALFFLSGVFLIGQNRPFPQEVDYPYGYQTSVIPSDSVQSLYNRWKGLFIGTCLGPLSIYRRVEAEDGSDTKSEGMGYGMILSAYFGEQGLFDSLFAFYKFKRHERALGLMSWHVTCPGTIDVGSATDGDIDVAYALVVAYYQWGGDYLTHADSILTILKDDYFLDTCGGGYVMQPGYSQYAGEYWGGCDETDLSYYPPAFFRVFADVTGEAFWDTVADDTYELLDSSAHPTTGLVPDWQTWDGNPVSGRDSAYHYDASRVPWRLVMDYIWNGNSNAQAACEKISDFADSIGPENILDGYYINGDSLGEWNNGSFVGGFAVGGMAHSQAMVDSFAGRLFWLDQQSWDDTYYNLTLKCIYELVLTGNFWDPLSPTGIEEKDSLPEGFYLAQNYPNPFRAATTIDYSIADAGFVRLAIYDVTGRGIKTLVEEFMPAGKHTVNVELKNLCPGVYIYRLETGGMSIQKKMILLK